MDNKVLLLTIILVRLNFHKVSSQHPGPKCESNKAWFGDPTVTKTLPGFCKANYQHVMKGDFNGDGRMDIMCHDSRNGRKWIYYGSNNGYSALGWSKDVSFCNHAGTTLFIGDFNGDSRDDMLCHDRKGHVFIAYADKSGHFAGTDWHKPMKFCKCRQCSVFVGDFNGDCKSDILCHDGKRGRKWIAYATADGNFNNAVIWSRNMHWCYSWGGKLYVGDFNGDHRDDMLCYDGSSVKGDMATAYAKWDGSFLKTDNTNNMGWCFANGCTLLVGQVSTDQKDDLVCHCKSPSTEPIRVRFPAFDDGFETFRQWRRTRSWCYKSSEVLLFGQLKPGHCASLVCIDKATGKYSIAFS